MRKKSKEALTERDYNKVVDKLSDGIYRFALRCCDDSEGAADAVQDAFVALWERREEVEDMEAARRFLLVVAKNRLYDLWRHKAVRLSYSADMMTTESVADDSVERMVMRDEIERALAALSVRQRTMLTLHDIEGYEYEEIAEMLGEEYTAVQVTVFRARIKMRKLLNYDKRG